MRHSSALTYKIFEETDKLRDICEALCSLCKLEGQLQESSFPTYTCSGSYFKNGIRINVSLSTEGNVLYCKTHVEKVKFLGSEKQFNVIITKSINKEKVTKLSVSNLLEDDRELKDSINIQDGYFVNGDWEALLIPYMEMNI